MDEASQNEVRRVWIRVSGRVQGVGYRFFAEDAAQALGITGWVQNQFDGSVELEAQGEGPAVEAFARALRDGPQLAYVADLQIHPMLLVTGEPGFDVRS